MFYSEKTVQSKMQLLHLCKQMEKSNYKLPNY